MKHLPLKLGIGVVLLFAAVIAVCLLWKPMKLRYYISKYKKAETAKERIEIINILCSCGEQGKKALYDAFRRRCLDDQVYITAGRLTLKNGIELKVSDLYVDKYEVTKEEYTTFLLLSEYQSDKPKFVNDYINELDYESPIVFISPEDAKKYAEWLGMRLPTDEEWEYVARAGSKNRYCFGDNANLLGEYAWYGDNTRDKPHCVGQKKPNKWGLFDVHGNVWEICVVTYYTGRRKILGDYVDLGGGFAYSSFKCGFQEFSDEVEPGHDAHTGFRCVWDEK